VKRRPFLLACGGFALAPSLRAQSGESGVFERPEPAGATAAPQQVFYHRPSTWDDRGRVVMVLHGLERAAERYCRAWTPLAQRHGFLLVCPEFTRAKFPGARWYNLGGVQESSDRERQAFAVPDRVFDDVRRRFGARAQRFSLYGHSAGGQFVHRFLLFAPPASAVDSSIAANPGWYTMPTFEEPFPYGLGNSGVTDAELVRYLRRPLVLELGEADTDSEDAVLRRDAGSMAQGPNRFARGLRFMELGRQEAGRRGVELAWQLVTVQGAGHSNRQMAARAAALLFP
jgi:poly(3-hydroxybutyrate) depolymerase